MPRSTHFRKKPDAVEAFKSSLAEKLERLGIEARSRGKVGFLETACRARGVPFSAGGQTADLWRRQRALRLAHRDAAGVDAARAAPGLAPPTGPRYSLPPPRSAAQPSGDQPVRAVVRHPDSRHLATRAPAKGTALCAPPCVAIGTPRRRSCAGSDATGSAQIYTLRGKVRCLLKSQEGATINTWL